MSMFETGGVAAVTMIAGLQVFGVMMGAVQGAIAAQGSRIGPDRRHPTLQRHSRILETIRMRLFGAVAVLLALLTVLGFIGLPVIVALAVGVNTVLPLIGCALFILPAWVVASTRVQRRLEQPVDAPA